MPDVQWTNEPVAPPKPGMSSTAKAVIGCGVLMLLAGGSCVGMVLWGGHKVVGAVSSVGEKEWPVMRQVAADLATDEGARHAWTSQPGLSKTYATEDDFLHQAQSIRPYLVPLPVAKPDLFGGPISYHSNSVNGFTQVEAGYMLRPDKLLQFSFENGSLINVQLAGGGTRTVPLRGTTGGDDDDSK